MRPAAHICPAHRWLQKSPRQQPKMPSGLETMVDRAASLQPTRAPKQQMPLAPCEREGHFPAHEGDPLCRPSGGAGSILGMAMSTAGYLSTVTRETNKRTNRWLLHTHHGTPTGAGLHSALTHTHTHKHGIPGCALGKGRSQDLRLGVAMPAVGDTDDTKKFREMGKNELKWTLGRGTLNGGAALLPWAFICVSVYLLTAGWPPGLQVAALL